MFLEDVKQDDTGIEPDEAAWGVLKCQSYPCEY
jgi:hypothetical protein